MAGKEKVACELDEGVVVSIGGEGEDEFGGKGRVFDEAGGEEAGVELVDVGLGFAVWEEREGGERGGPWLMV